MNHVTLWVPPVPPRVRDTFEVLPLPRFFDAPRITYDIPVGRTLLDVVSLAGIPPRRWDRLAIYIGEHRADPDYWHCIRPKAGAKIVLVELPGNTRTIITVLAVVAIAVAAAYTGGLAAGAYGPLAGGAYAGSTAALAVGAAVTAGVGIGGQLALMALIPPEQPQLDSVSGSSFKSTYFLQGAQNELRPFAPVPIVFGRMRHTPPFGAPIYYEYAGTDQYMRCLVIWGYGPLSVEDIRIGNTPITDYQDVEIETRTGAPDDDAPLTLFPSVAQETRDGVEGVELELNGPWVERTTPPDSDELALDFLFPEGLFSQDNEDGDTHQAMAQVTAQLLINGVWTQSWAGSSIMTIKAERLTNWVFSKRWKLPNRGEWRWRTRKTNESDGSTRTHHNKTVLQASRIFTNEDPVRIPGLARSAIRIRRSGQFTGTVNTINAICTSLKLDDDGLTYVPTRRPADHMRRFLTGPMNAAAIPESAIDVPAFDRFLAWCEEWDWTCDYIVDSWTSVWEILTTLGATARAKPDFQDGLWTVVVDEPQAMPVAVVTPRNARVQPMAHALNRHPHAIRVRFPNEEKGYAQDETLIYADGYTAANAQDIEDQSTIGITNRERIRKIKRIEMAEARLRPELHAWETDVQGIIPTRGDLIIFASDVPRFGAGYGRLESVETDAVRLDTTVVVPASPVLRVWLSEQGEHVDVPIATTPGTQGTYLELAATPSGPIAAGDMFVLGEVNKVGRPLVIKEVRPASQQGFSFVGIDHAPEIYDAPSGTIPPWDPGTTVTDPYDDRTPPLPEIAAVIADERVLDIGADGTLITRLFVRLARYGPPGGQTELQGWRDPVDDPDVIEDYRPLVLQPAGSLEIYTRDVVEGHQYRLRVRFLLADGTPGLWRVHSPDVFVAGKTSLPPAPTGFTLTELANGQRQFFWSMTNRPRDLRGFLIRYAYGVVTPSWDAMTPLHTGFLTASPLETAEPSSPGACVFAIRSVDTSDNLSDPPTYAAYTLGGTGGDPVTSDPEPPGGDWEGVPWTVVRRANTLDGKQIATVRFDWQPVTFAPGLGGYQLRIAPPTGTVMIVPADTDAEEVDIEAGVSYTVDFRPLSGAGRQGPWSSPITVDLSVDPTVTTVYQIPPESLTTGEINAAEILVRGAGEPGYVGISGLNSQIYVVDGNGTTRVVMGKLGSDAAAWAITIRDAAGNEILGQTGLLDGFYIKNLTVGTLKIMDGAISNFAFVNSESNSSAPDGSPNYPTFVEYQVDPIAPEYVLVFQFHELFSSYNFSYSGTQLNAGPAFRAYMSMRIRDMTNGTTVWSRNFKVLDISVENKSDLDVRDTGSPSNFYPMAITPVAGRLYRAEVGSYKTDDNGTFSITSDRRSILVNGYRK